jgi:hypothetical protein
MAPGRGERTSQEQQLADFRETLSIERIKQLISAATERPEGLVIQVVSTQLHSRVAKRMFKNDKPSHFIVTDDNRCGFCIDGQSYMTANVISTLRFFRWLKLANTNAVGQKDYGQPAPECEFRQTR